MLGIEQVRNFSLLVIDGFQERQMHPSPYLGYTTGYQRLSYYRRRVSQISTCKDASYRI